MHKVTAGYFFEDISAYFGSCESPIHRIVGEMCKVGEFIESNEASKSAQEKD